MSPASAWHALGDAGPALGRARLEPAVGRLGDHPVALGCGEQLGAAGSVHEVVELVRGVHGSGIHEALAVHRADRPCARAGERRVTCREEEVGEGAGRGEGPLRRCRGVVLVCRGGRLHRRRQVEEGIRVAGLRVAHPGFDGGVRCAIEIGQRESREVGVGLAAGEHGERAAGEVHECAIDGCRVQQCRSRVEGIVPSGRSGDSAKRESLREACIIAGREPRREHALVGGHGMGLRPLVGARAADEAHDEQRDDHHEGDRQGEQRQHDDEWPDPREKSVTPAGGRGSPRRSRRWRRP